MSRGPEYEDDPDGYPREIVGPWALEKLNAFATTLLALGVRVGAWFKMGTPAPASSFY